ncbi:uncharacterized protein LOC129615002 [Condylostylus longicornis]|uniref:uncharacterized protein LOC129615002 n=1 Tax=Condylostylus longicornis TaxID=2530218 RepID=UPI00244E2E6F|nr:uncharacterized protein LOC129615002 [Condylostylus longicornis]
MVNNASNKWKKIKSTKSKRRIRNRKIFRRNSIWVQNSLGSAAAGNKMQNTTNTKAAAVLWRKTYESCINWHNFYQMHYWKNLAFNLKNKNNELQKQLDEYKHIIKGQNIQINSLRNEDEKVEYETSSSEGENYDIDIHECETIEEVDEEYLKFLEITYKHREEIKNKKIFQEGHI